MEVAVSYTKDVEIHLDFLESWIVCHCQQDFSAVSSLGYTLEQMKEQAKHTVCHKTLQHRC